MKISSTVAFACFSMAAIIGNSCAACAIDDPVAIAKSFYTKHAAFASENPDKLKPLITDRFFIALNKEYKCAQGEICAIESDPWTDAQDGKIGKPVEFESVSNSDMESVVAMSFPFILDKSHHEQLRAKIILQRKTSTDCWLVGDVVDPHGGSLLQFVEDWHKQYGADAK